MIHVDRGRVPVPDIFSSSLAETQRQRAREWFKQMGMAKVRQERYYFEAKIWLEAKRPLDELFQFKCAYCEKDLRQEPSVVDHFRPYEECIGLDGKPFKDGYWWLAYEWDNLYPVCRECASIKGNRFPVAGDHLAADEQGDYPLGQTVHQEHAILLDPCYDYPERYLQFWEDGTVRGILPPDPLDPDPFKDYNRGEVTIDLLGLNRSDLVAPRGALAGQIVADWDRFLQAKSDPKEVEMVLSQLRRRLGFTEGAPFAGMARQLISRRLQDALGEPGRLGVQERSVLHPLASELGISIPEPEPGKGDQPSLAVEEGLPEGPTVQGDIPKSAASKSRVSLGTSTGYITQIEIKNFKAIRHMVLQIPGPFEELLDAPASPAPADPVQAAQSNLDVQANIAVQNGPVTVAQTFAPWKVLLGENGTGKSSVLQAVALALMGQDFIKSHGFKASKLLRRTHSGQAKKGFVKVRFSDQTQAVELHFDRSGFRFINGGQGVQLYLRGYGATRLLPGLTGKQAPPSSLPQREVENLFDPFDPLFDAETWLLDPKNTRFDSLALAYKDILKLGGKGIFKRGRKNVRMIDPQGIPVSLDELSDGYQSVLALATDIIAGVSEELSDFHNAYGIVLIDEIGANLHPRWRMEFITSVRRTFPKMQFLVTTHEPLCLRGLKKGEIAVIRRLEDGREMQNRGGVQFSEKRSSAIDIVVLDEGLPDPGQMRTDQLLTSHFFGLHSTIDPKIDENFQAYYTLLNKQKNEQGLGLSPQELALRDGLKAELEQYNMALGYTRRDQMAYDLIDEFLKIESKALQEGNWQKLRDETRQKVFDIWRLVQFRQGGGR